MSTPPDRYCLLSAPDLLSLVQQMNRHGGDCVFFIDSKGHGDNYRVLMDLAGLRAFVVHSTEATDGGPT